MSCVLFLTPELSSLVNGTLFFFGVEYRQFESQITNIRAAANNIRDFNASPDSPFGRKLQTLQAVRISIATTHRCAFQKCSDTTLMFWRLFIQ